MKRTIFGALLVAVGSTLALAALLFTARPLQAQVQNLCYAVADNGGATGSPDALVTLDRLTGETELIGFTDTSDIEAIAFTLGGGRLFAANGDQLGTLDLTSGVFTALPSEFGSGDGAAGTVEFNDVDGLTVDPTSGILYGTHRRRGADRDLLFQIDMGSGAHVPNAFGPDMDYVVIDGPGVLSDVDDIAVDPITEQMYAASNDDGAGGLLITVDKTSGTATVVGEFGVDDIEGLAYFNDGQLYGSTGKYSTGPATRNQLYAIDESTGEATFVAAFSEYGDYEALGCLTGPTSVSLAGISVAGAGTLSLWLLAVLGTLGALTLLALRRNRS